VSRPPDSPRTRGLKKLLRASYWRAILRDELPAELDPEGLAGTVDRCGGRPKRRVDHDGNQIVDRTRLDDVDNVTADILGKSHPDLRRRRDGDDGVRTIEAARRRKPITDPEAFGALSAALRWLQRRE